MSIKSFSLENLGGSLHSGLPASQIGDNEWADIINLYQYKKKLVQRPGIDKLTMVTPLTSAPIRGMVAFKTSIGEWALVLGLGDSLAFVDGTSITIIPVTDGQIWLGTGLWTFVQYNDYLIAAKPGNGTLKHSDGSSFVMDGGIAAPVSGPTLATGAGGAILAGDYYAVAVYRNSATGMVSQVSPVSSVYTAPQGAAKIDWSAIVASPNGQVDVIDLYRTLRNQQGAYFFVATIPNGQTTYTGDNLLTDDLGDAVSLVNYPPPDDIESVIGPWKERLVCHDGQNVYVSNYQLLEAFDLARNTFPISTDDGHRIRGIKPWGDRIFIGKTNGLWLLNSPDGFTFSLIPFSQKHGCWSQHSIQEIDGGGLIWFGGDDFYMSENGAPPIPIGDSKIRDIIARVDLSESQNMVSAIYPALSWYVVNLPIPVDSEDPDNDDRLLVFNYSTGVWTTFRYNVTNGLPNASHAPSFLADFFDENYNRLLYATFGDSNVWNLIGDTFKDDGTQVTASLRSKAYSMSDPSFLHMMRNVVIDCDSLNEDVTFSLYRDRSSSAYKSRAVNLSGTGWKPIRLSSIGAPSYMTQLGISHTGNLGLVIAQLAFDLVSTSGRRRFSR